MRRTILGMLVLGAALSCFYTAASAEPTTFYAQDRAGRNVVKFESGALLETIVGVTNQITGQIKVDPTNIKDQVAATFEVELASLKTGIDLRDQHMRNNYLETDKFPKATFTLDKIISSTKNALGDQQTVDLVAEGTFDIHGVKRKKKVNLKVTYFKESAATRARLPGDLIKIRSDFVINLTEHNIEIPSMIALKLDENIKVNIDVFASNAAP